MGCDLITDLKLILDFDIQCITWDNIDNHMNQQGELLKETTHYEDLYTGLMAPVRTVLEAEHVHKAIKRQTKILDAHYEAADLKEIIDYVETINEEEKRDVLL
jgi:hypothetical protein